MVKILELFGGIGAIRKAFINLKIPFEVTDYVELDKAAVRSYNAMYDESYEPKDITKYSYKGERVDILMHGRPCQDFSIIGLKAGGEKGAGTRSSLLFETVRVIEEMKEKPRIVIWENVKGVLTKKMSTAFFHYLGEMKRLGYESAYRVLNAMEYGGVPQKRERIFIVSVPREKAFDFEQVKKKECMALDEILEQDVDMLYEVRQPSMLKRIGSCNGESSFNGTCPIIKDFVHTITTKQMRVPNCGVLWLGGNKYRYITEREAFKLMGFSDKDFDRALSVNPRKEGCTSSLLYRQAGGSIVIGCLEGIILALKGQGYLDRKEKDFEKN